MDNLDDNRGPQLVAVTATFLILVWISVSLRCSVRLLIMKEFKYDDVFLVLALFAFTVMAIFVFVGVHFGLGKHNAALEIQDEIFALKYQALATIVYIADMALVKTSIAIFLLRIAVQSRYIYTIKISIIIVALWTTAMFLYNIFQCNPVAAQWDLRLNETADCVSGSSYVSAAYAFSVLAILSDWLYALIPIPMIWKVKMSFQTKCSIIFILALGILASVATLVRLVYISNLADFSDILYSTTDTLIWTIAEPALGMIAASIVALRPLLRALKVPGFNSEDETGSSGNRKQSGIREIGSRLQRSGKGAPDGGGSRTYVRAGPNDEELELDNLPNRGVDWGDVDLHSANGKGGIGKGGIEVKSTFHVQNDRRSMSNNTKSQQSLSSEISEDFIFVTGATILRDSGPEGSLAGSGSTSGISAVREGNHREEV